MSIPNRTQNAALTVQSTSNAQARTERQYAVQEKVREIQRENPGMSYDEAYSKVRQLPEMERTFNSMQKPDEIPDPFKVNELGAAQRKASAQFRGKVEAAANQRGVTFDQAWQAMQTEEPELYQAMVGENDPVKRIKESMGWRD